jgi:hypothetical protein
MFEDKDRFKVACKMLRLGGCLDVALPGQRKGESPIDYLVRHKLAIDVHHAAYALIEGQGLTAALDDVMAIPFLESDGAPDGA